jgi:plastocyanin domain-containing protein
MTIRNGFALIDFNIESAQANTPSTQTTSAVVDKNGIQKIAMKINGYDYEPYKFTVKKGIPVEWTIDASVAGGCMRAGIVAPGLGIQERLNSGKTIVRFTPYTTGKFKFSCPMGMGTFGAHINVVE